MSNDVSLFIVEHIELGKSILIKFPYNKSYIERIKNELFPRVWDKDSKCWITPVSNIASVLSIFPNSIQSQGFKEEFNNQKNFYIENKSLKETEYDIDSNPITLYKHQKQTINYLVNKKQAGVLSEMGCIEGDAQLTIIIDNILIDNTLRYLYKNFDQWKREGKFINTFSMVEGTELSSINVIKDVLYKGEKPVLSLKMLLNNKIEYTIKATEDHKFYTEEGWFELSKIKLTQKIKVKNPNNNLLEFAEIISIIDNGEVTDVYDIMMEGPNHNFIANNIIVHNCGKSFALIYTYKALLEKGLVDKVLVLCPSSLTYNWYNEVLKTNLFVPVIVEGTKEQKINILKSKTGNFFITNYEAIINHRKKNKDEEKKDEKEYLDIEKELTSFIQKHKFMLVIDESHRIKGRSGKVFKFLRKLIKHIQYRYISTGTLIANRPEDAWSQMFVINPNILGTSFFSDFARRFCVTGNNYSEYAIVGYKNLDQLKFIIEQNTIRHLKKDVLDLPDKIYKNYYINMDKKQQNLYNELENNILKVIEEYSEDINKITTNVFTLIEMASNPNLLDDSFPEETEKLKELDILLDENIMISNRKVILWTNFVKNIKLFENRYKKYNPRVVYGAVGNKERQDAVNDFQQDDTVKLFIANPAAAGVGLTLTASDLAIFYDRGFSYTQWAQATDRNHRIGAKNNVEVISLINRDTIDEGIDKVLSNKEDLSDYLTNKNFSHSNKKEVLKKLIKRDAKLF